MRRKNSISKSDIIPGTPYMTTDIHNAGVTQSRN